METQKLKDLSGDVFEDARRRERERQRDAYFVRCAAFMKGAPKLRGERLRKLLASCPPKTYRHAEAAHA